MFGLLTKILPLILNLVRIVERLSGADGGEKRAIVIDLIIPVVRVYEAIKDNDFLDEVALKVEIGRLVDAVVGVANLFGLLGSESS